MSSLFHHLSPACFVLLLAMAAGGALAQTPATVPPPPPPPAPPSPVAYFRQLLAASPAERERLLAGKTPEQVRVLTNSIRTYLALSEAERDTRLRTMELRSHLAPLLRLAPAERSVKLKTVPAEYLVIIQERLAYFDTLSSNVQQQIIVSERTGLATTKAPPLPPIPVAINASTPQAALKSVLAPWRAVTPARKDEVIAAFTNLFNQPPAQTSKTLDPLPLSPTERALIEKALETFRRMQPAQRQACVSGFKRFAELAPAERIQFLRNAEAWHKMAPEDRQRWRDLINIMPQLPSSPGTVAPPLPPIPQPPVPASSYASNSLPHR